MDFVITGHDFTISNFALNIQHSQEIEVESELFIGLMKINFDEFRSLLACY